MVIEMTKEIMNMGNKGTCKTCAASCIGNKNLVCGNPFSNMYMLSIEIEYSCDRYRKECTWRTNTSDKMRR